MDIGSLSANELKAMHTLQGKLVSPPIMILLYAGDRYNLHTDACNVRVGYVMPQKELGGTTKPIGYLSRSLNTAEQCYDKKQRECLVII